LRTGSLSPADWSGGWCGVAIRADCLMPNRVHLVAVPESPEGLRRGIGQAHRHDPLLQLLE